MRTKLRDPSGRKTPEAILTVRAHGYMAGPDLQRRRAPVARRDRPMKEWFCGKWGGVAAFIGDLRPGGRRPGLGHRRGRAPGRASNWRHMPRRSAPTGCAWPSGGSTATSPPLIAVEDGRPFNHYSAVFAAPLAFDNRGVARPPGAVVEPSPLLNADLPDWMLLHFQLDAALRLGVAAGAVRQPVARLAKPAHPADCWPTPRRSGRRLLDELKRCLKPAALIAAVRERVSPATHKDKILLPAKRPPDVCE